LLQADGNVGRSDAGCGVMLYRHVDKVGVELEGSWDGTTVMTGFHGDGSVTTVGYQTGEVSSPALHPSDLCDWIRREEIYPTYVNQSCGFHVHISTKTYSDYAALMHEKFNDAFLDNCEAWGHSKEFGRGHQYFARLRGENQYCAKRFIPLKQYFHKGKGYDRYTQLNYCAGVHRTLENRTFPMFESRNMAADCVKNYVEFVELWLRENGHKLAGKVSITEPFDQQVERIIIRGTAA
jgi:hypothetical protein